MVLLKDDNTEDTKSSIAALLAESIDPGTLNKFPKSEIYYLYLDLHINVVADITCVNVNVREQIQGDYKLLPNGRSPPRTICIFFMFLKLYFFIICFFILYFSKTCFMGCNILLFCY